MSTQQTYEKASLAAGELSDELHAATDLRAYQTGVARQENFVTLLEGVVTRCPGTRFIAELKNEAQRGKLWPFRYAKGDYYMLVFNGGKMRVVHDAGLVTSGVGGPVYEVTIPWTEAQLTTLRGAPLNNTLTFAVSGGRIVVVTRIAGDQWSVEEYLPKNGPIGTQNLNKTITVLPSATQGAVTLAGINGPFKVGDLGGVMRIDEANATLTPLWTAAENITQTLTPLPVASGSFGDMTDMGKLIDGDPMTYALRDNVRACYAGWTYAAPTAISALTVMPSGGSFTTVSQELTLEMWAKVGAAPINDTNGVLLGRKQFIDASNDGGVTVYSSDADALWSHIWFRLVAPGGPANFKATRADLTKRPVGYPMILRRWGENIYEAITDGSAGSSPPVHDADDAGYGGVVWRFRSKTYGFVRITSVTDANTAAGVVTLRLPDSALLAPSYRWWPPAWSDGEGWPETIQQHQQKLLFGRKGGLWITRPPPERDFLFTPNDDSAIAVSLTPPDGGARVDIQWMASSGIVVLGTADIEWSLRAPGSNDVLQAKTIDPVPDSQEGSRPQIPAKVDRGVVFVGANGQRLHYLKFDGLTQQLEPKELSAYARAVLGPGVAKVVWQKDPHKILWCMMDDGSLVGATFMPAQNIAAFWRRPMQNAFVEDIEVLPTLTDGRVDLYLTVRRVINGQTRRYIEMLQPFFKPRPALRPTAEGAWFVDCGISYSGVPVTRVLGAGHLVGQSVAVFADGAMQNRKVVAADGGVTLDAEASEVVLGIPQVARLRDLPRSLQVGGGTTRGKRQRATHVMVDVLHGGGGQVRVTYPAEDRNADPDDYPVTDTPFDDLIETGTDDYGMPVRLYTGQVPQVVTSESADTAVTEIVMDDAMPMTVRAITPDVMVEGN